VLPVDRGRNPVVLMADPASGAVHGGSLRFTPTAADPVLGDVTVILDTAWTPPGPGGSVPASAGAAATGLQGPVAIGLRDVAQRILAVHDLIAETSAHLDRWAATSGVIERLTLRETSFWFYVRLRHWAWLQDRVLWAGIADLLIQEHRPRRIVCAPGADEALLEVLRLMAVRHDLELVEETVPPPEPDAAARAAAAAAAKAAAANRSPSRAAGGRPRRSRRARLRRLVGRIVRPVRNRLFGPPPPPPHVARQLELKARLAQIGAHVDALAAEPESRLLVVHEHARQRVDTPSGPRSMNPYLDPIVDRLRGTALEPIVLDIRARVSQDPAWERIGSGHEPRLLPIDALGAVVDPAAAAARGAVPGAGPGAATAPGPMTMPGVTPAPGPAPTPGPPPAGHAPEQAATRVGVAPAPAPPTAPPPIDPVLAAWRDGLACPIEAFGIDLAPLLAADVVTTASRFLPGMTASIERIERFLERIRPAGIVLADEYHRQDWMAAARSVGIPVAAVQHGMIYAHHNGYIHAARPAGLRLPERTYVFGRWERDLLRTASVYRDDEVVVGGSPRLDLIAAGTLDDQTQLRRELGVADDERLVVVSGTWGTIYRRFHYPIALAALVDRPLPRVHVVVKLHPGEPDEGPYRQILEAAARARGVPPPRITTVQSVDLYRLLAAADAHLGIHSTVLTEAVITRTPNLLADGLAGADLLGYVEAGVATRIRDGGDLLAALDAAAAGGVREADAAAFSGAHFEPGPASERIAASLLAWLA
jgi:hypothetical protein